MAKRKVKKEEISEEKTTAVEAAAVVIEKKDGRKLKIPSEIGIQPDLTVVVTYCEGDDDADMLKYAVRSVQKNLIGVDVNVLVVGNKKPDFVKPEDFIKADIKSMGIWGDQWRVADLLLENKDVYEDIVLLTPGMLCNIAVVKANPEDTPSVKALRALGLNAQDYDTHTPVFFFKDMIRRASQFKEVKACSLITALYSVFFNDDVQPHIIETKAGAWKNGPWLLPVISSNPQIAVLEHFFRVKNFAYFSAYSCTEAVKQFLEEKFPEKSCIEIG